MNRVEYETGGAIFNIQHYSLHDGPDIRTAPFFKGRPLSCRWRSNPESQCRSLRLLFKKNDCIRYRKRIDTYPRQALSTTNVWFINHDRCIQCGECTEIYPTRTLEMEGKCVSVTTVMRELEKEESLYRRSGGGVTLSDGEPLAQPEFARELLKAYKAKSWHAAIETSGFITKAMVDEVSPYVDLTLTGIKTINPEIHGRNTGVNNRAILENLLRISFLTKVVVRIPVIPGMNDNSQEIHNIAEFAHLMRNVDTIHLLPYHSLSGNKYSLLGRQYPMGDTESIEEAQIAELKAMVGSSGFNCHTGG